MRNDLTPLNGLEFHSHPWNQSFLFVDPDIAT
jgi:hypothetical protein